MGTILGRAAAGLPAMPLLQNPPRAIRRIVIGRAWHPFELASTVRLPGELRAAKSQVGSFARRRTTRMASPRAKPFLDDALFGDRIFGHRRRCTVRCARPLAPIGRLDSGCKPNIELGIHPAFDREA